MCSIWRNAFLNRKPLEYHASLSLPNDGILELDFVQISKAAVHHKPMSNAELLLLKHSFGKRLHIPVD